MTPPRTIKIRLSATGSFNKAFSSRCISASGSFGCSASSLRNRNLSIMSTAGQATRTMGARGFHNIT